MLQYFETLQDESGNAISLDGVGTVTVTAYPSGAAVTLYSTNGTANPIASGTVSADITGQISFFVPDGVYILTYYLNGTQYKQKSPVQLIDPVGFIDYPDTGIANTYVVTNAAQSASLYVGLRATFTALYSNTGASTFNLNGTGAQPVLQVGGVATGAGVITAGGIYQVMWTGSAWQLLNSASLSSTVIGALLYPVTPAESTGLIAPAVLNDSPWVYDVRRAGVIPNSLGAAAANTAALKALFNPAVVGPTGQFIFPNTTGADIYYVNGVIAVRDGVDINGQNVTLSCTMTGSTADNAAGVFTAQRGFSVSKMNFVLNYTTGAGYPSGYNNNGNILMFGGRGAQPSLFPAAVYDSLLAAPMGKIVVKDCTFNITSNATNSRAILMLGGLVNVTIEGNSFQGNGTAYEAYYYEFGYATNETDQSAMQTSHGHNFGFRNNTVDNFTFSAISGNGAYDITIDGAIVTRCAQGSYWGVGQANFFRPCGGPPNVLDDVAGAKHGITIKNYVCDSPSGTAITITGDAGGASGGGLGSAGGLWNAWTASHTYISSLQANGTYDNSVVSNGGNLYVVANGGGGISAGSGGPTGTGTGITDGTVTWNYVPLSQVTDLLDAVVENVKVRNAGGYGIRFTGATKATLRHSYFVGCQRGIVTDQECTLYSIEGCTVRDSTSFGIQIGLNNTIYNPARQSLGKIRDCFIAGSAASPAILVATSIGCTIESCRFGYETIHDGVAETTQTYAVSVNTDAYNVILRDCYIAGSNSATVLNNAAAGSSSRGQAFYNCTGGPSLSSANSIAITGLWSGDIQSNSAVAIVNSATITSSGLKSSRVAPTGAVTGIILQAGGFPGQEVTVVNESAAGDTVTFAAVATSNVADGVSDVIAGLTSRKFIWDPGAGTPAWFRAA